MFENYDALRAHMANVDHDERIDLMHNHDPQSERIALCAEFGLPLRDEGDVIAAGVNDADAYIPIGELYASTMKRGDIVARRDDNRDDPTIYRVADVEGEKMWVDFAMRMTKSDGTETIVVPHHRGIHVNATDYYVVD